MKIETSLPPQYEHSPLPGENWIRLLRLLPQEADSPGIAAHLTAHELDENILAYTTLSYTWGRNSDGDASLSHDLSIDGSSLAVTENLHDFLVRMQAGHDERQLLFWIDAVCINQKDVGERNSQVAKMANIYQRASTMIMWLGNGNSVQSDTAVSASCQRLLRHDNPFGSKPRPNLCNEFVGHLDPRRSNVRMSLAQRVAFRAARFLATCDERRRGSWSRWLLTRSTSLSELAWRLMQFALQDARDDPQYVEEIRADVQALATLCDRRYFSRRWVVQEMYHSDVKSTRVYWGPCFVEALKMERAVETALQIDLWFLQLRMAGWSHVGLNNDAFWFASGIFGAHSRDDSILNVLEAFRHTSCKDDRDRLFALLSIGRQNIMLPDYNLTAEEAFTIFAKRMVQLGHASDILKLAACQKTVQGSQSVSLPSWVPDLRLPLYLLKADRATMGPPHLIDRVAVTGGGLSLTAHVRLPFLEEYIQPGFRIQQGDLICRTHLYTGSMAGSGAVLRPTLPQDPLSPSYTVLGWSNSNNSAKAKHYFEQEMTIC